MKIISEPTLDRFRACRQCELCKDRVRGCDPNHTYSRRWRLDIACALSALCRLCHTKYHANADVKAEVKRIIAAREGTTVDAIWDVVCVLRRLPTLPSPERIAAESYALDLAGEILLRQVRRDHPECFRVDMASEPEF